MSLIDKLKQIKKALSPHEPLIELFVYGQNLLHNLAEYQKAYPKLQFAPVLKANAYGHGLSQVLEVIRGNNKIPFVVLDSHFEARAARHYAPELKVLIIGYSRLESIAKTSSSQAAFTLISLDQLKEVSKGLRSKKRFHLKLDTGMHRQGVRLEEAKEAISLIKANSNILLEGLCSHLADPGNAAGTSKQIDNWNQGVKIFKLAFPKILFWHLAATGGVHLSPKVDANLVRLGIGFYGIGPIQPENLNLKPALEMRSLITGVKNITPGEQVGYGFTFTAKHNMRLATIPVGFSEGVDRRLSNNGFFKVGEIFCPLAGRVSMNISTLDVTGVPSAKRGDEVVVISANPKDKNSVENIARACQTVNYEILIHLPQHLRRTVI